MSGLIPFNRGRGMTNSARSLFDDGLFRSFFDMRDAFSGTAFRVDIKDKKDHYELDAEVPGAEKEQIDLSVENNILTISANMNIQNKEEKEGYVLSERRSGHFCRNFNIEGIKDDEITATFQNGILKLILPKKQIDGQGKQKRIHIQ